MMAVAVDPSRPAARVTECHVAHRAMHRLAPRDALHAVSAPRAPPPPHLPYERIGVLICVALLVLPLLELFARCAVMPKGIALQAPLVFHVQVAHKVMRRRGRRARLAEVLNVNRSGAINGATVRESGDTLRRLLLKMEKAQLLFFAKYHEAVSLHEQTTAIQGTLDANLSLGELRLDPHRSTLPADAFFATVQPEGVGQIALAVVVPAAALDGALKGFVLPGKLSVTFHLLILSLQVFNRMQGFLFRDVT